MDSTILYISLISVAGIDGVSMTFGALALVVFLIGWTVNRYDLRLNAKQAERIGDMSAILQHALNQNNTNVINLSIIDRRAFNIHGHFLPDSGMSYDESLKHVHPDDLAVYMSFMGRMLQGEKIAECTFRWSAEEPGQEKDWRVIHYTGLSEYTGAHQKMPLYIYCTVNDLTDLSEQQEAEMQLTEKYHKIYERAVVGLAFYDGEGKLINANSKMREILKFQSEDDPYYYQNSIFDMPTFREVLNNRHVEELWFCTKSVIVERGVNCYTELRVHPIFDENNKLVYISFSIRDITQERELYLQNRRNDAIIRQGNESIQQYESELQYLMESCNMRFWRSSYVTSEIIFYKGLSKPEKSMEFSEFLGHLVTPNEDLTKRLSSTDKKLTEAKAYLCLMHPIFNESREPQWNYIDCVPYYNADGSVAGSYGIMRNVHSLIDKQEKLKQETERAKDSGQMKSAFMANMTHEIRTPLNSIVGFSDVLPMMESQEEKNEIIKVIMNNCDMLLRLINDILAVSSLDSTGIVIDPSEVDFAESFNTLCESLAQRVQNPGVEFVADNPYDHFVTSIDNSRIQQIITNFVTNAVKYTQQGHIKVGYTYRDGGLYIYCEDTGSGVPKDDQTRIFERFVKLNDYIQGTGLGLSICKAITDRCNGKIGVISEGEGLGSTFWIWIPCNDYKQ